MASVTVSGALFCSDGTVIDLEATLVEATESNLTVNTTYSVTASNIGDYAPGKTITGGYVQGHNGISYAYVLRQGLVEGIVPVCMKGLTPANWPLCRPITLQPGDILRCMTNTASDRELALCVYTNKGVSRIFTVTPSSATTNEPIDLQTGNGLGDTLTGQIIVKAFCSSVDGNKINGGGAVAVNEKGMPVGVVPANNPQSTPLYFSSVSIPVALNYQWAVVTTS